MKDKPELSAPIAQLKSQWMRLSDVQRARRIAAIKRSGASIRRISRELGADSCGFSESNLRHLLKVLRARREDLELAEHGQLSTRELARRADDAERLREQQRDQVVRAERQQAAQEGADLICKWLDEEGVYGPDGKQIIEKIRQGFAMMQIEGKYPPVNRPGRNVTVRQIIERCRPEHVDPDILNLNWYIRWLGRWTFYALPDPDVRSRAIDIALSRQTRR